jgi:hypothetical protein
MGETTLKSGAAKRDDRLTRHLQIPPNGTALQRTVEKYRRHFVVFVTTRDPPTINNGSEQALRP